MATLVLGTIGTLVGGPLGGAIGSVLGRGLDAAIIGSPAREGPRLNDLAVSTSSYGQPLAALYGRVRTPGTVIWATDLNERRETSGGGKGRPKTTAYSYTVSLAVALSSRPIDRVGRIWADGNLLRGTAGDLKTGGSLRVHTGHRDQRPDPLMAAAIGAQCSAHRGCAYAVFEDLALEDFGNRIPALSFEVFAGSAARLVSAIAGQSGFEQRGTEFAELEGFLHDGGSAAALLELVARLRPLAVRTASGQPVVTGADQRPETVPMLSPATAWQGGEFAPASGAALARKPSGDGVAALRYYDPSRGYQPGLQRAEGVAASPQRRVLEFPGVLSAGNAKALLAGATARTRQAGETIAWRMAQLDPAIGPGAIVRVPGHAGLWQITSWEWREGGIELVLARFVARASTDTSADGGVAWSPADRLAAETRLRVFELPWDGHGASETIHRFAALSAPAGRWAGAALYRVEGETLVPLSHSGPVRAIGGTLTAPLGSSPGLRFEPRAALRIALDDEEAVLEPATANAIARGANRLLVGDEILQFARSDPEGSGVWRLSGLLRGRGGTEHEALSGHAHGARVTLLDNRLVELPADLAPGQGNRFAAIGAGDDQPVVAQLENPGRSRRPLFPVHPRQSKDANGGLVLQWTRRARGGWNWLNEVEQPLVEQSEQYEIGLGDPAAPDRAWATTEARFLLSPPEMAALVADFPGGSLWVRQQGSFAASAPLRLFTLPFTP